VLAPQVKVEAGPNGSAGSTPAPEKAAAPVVRVRVNRARPLFCVVCANNQVSVRVPRGGEHSNQSELSYVVPFARTDQWKRTTFYSKHKRQVLHLSRSTNSLLPSQSCEIPGDVLGYRFRREITRSLNRPAECIRIWHPIRKHVPGALKKRSETVRPITLKEMDRNLDSLSLILTSQQIHSQRSPQNA
jgi:hypothetical protein